MTQDSAYEARSDEILAFGPNWCGPDRFEHGDDPLTLVATYQQVGSSGQPVEVYCSAWPARFYRIVALRGDHRFRREFEINTGSGLTQFAASLAENIAEGMLEFVPDISESTQALRSRNEEAPDEVETEESA